MSAAVIVVPGTESDLRSTHDTALGATVSPVESKRLNTILRLLSNLYK
jgi:hypothetical protein